MADMKQIHEFALKWIEKFKDQKINYIEFVDDYMADDCATLGFEMDGGHAFERVYGAALNNSDELDKVIDDITDISLLGSAIYSKSRYFKRCGETAEILEQNNRVWFVTALERLLKILELIKEQILEIKDSYPYTLKPIVESEELTAEKKADLEETISILKEIIETYKKRIEEMMR